MSGVLLLAGPIGAGKTTVARELAKLLPGPLAVIEGDDFWRFLAKPKPGGVRDNFVASARAMMAAAAQLARSDYNVLLDFSIPPRLLPTAQKFFKELPFDYVVLRPSLAVCAARAATRPEGRIEDYSDLREFYEGFADAADHILADEVSNPATLAARIHADLATGRYRVAPAVPGS
jgi:chloramphenicol 3-O-phosphotransferase